MEPLYQQFKELDLSLFVNLHHFLGLLNVSSIFCLLFWAQNVLDSIRQNFYQALSKQICLTVEKAEEA